MADEQHYEGPERRANLERRDDPPITCERLCVPIVEEFKIRDSEIKDRDKFLHEKLRKIFDCLERKVPSKLFYWVMSGVISAGAFFSIVVVGGTLWNLSDKTNLIATDIKVMNVTVEASSDALRSHIVATDVRFREQEVRIDKIEKGETYYQYHNREFVFKNKENP